MILRRLGSTTAAHAAAYRLPPNICQLLTSTNAHTPSTSAVVSGWIKSVRKQKNVTFALVSDGSSVDGLQAVLVHSKDTVQDDGLLRRLTNGCAVRMTGLLVPSSGKGQKIELLIDESQGGRIEVLGECDPDTYPIQKQSLSTEYLRENLHLRARTTQVASMLRLRDRLTRRIHAWFEAQGFCFVNTPILTSSDAEGAGESFRIADIAGEPSTVNLSTHSQAIPETSRFFSRPAYLTVSHQLHLEALATSISRVYSFSPCFRAEPSLTGRHLAEFWMLEAEWAFGNETLAPLQKQRNSNDVEQVCALVEGCLRGVAGDVATAAHDADLNSLWNAKDSAKRQSLQDAFSFPTPWQRMTYTEAVKELAAFNIGSKTKFEFEPAWGNALQSEHERWLAETLVKAPVFVTDYPAVLKPFYMRENDEGDGEGTVACVDLLVPHVGELVGGSVREDRVDLLRAKMESMGMVGDGYEWYEDLRRYGGAPHAGFGMGFERLVSWISGIDNVRECVPMPRWNGRMLL